MFLIFLLSNWSLHTSRFKQRGDETCVNLCGDGVTEGVSKREELHWSVHPTLQQLKLTILRSPRCPPYTDNVFGVLFEQLLYVSY